MGVVFTLVLAAFVAASSNVTAASPAGWTKTTVQGGGFFGEYVSTAIDSQGVTHVAYYDSVNEDLKYANNSGGIWTNVTVDIGFGHAGDYCAIAVASNGSVFISYHKLVAKILPGPIFVTNGVLAFAMSYGGSWHTSVVDDQGTGTDVGQATSIALDNQGHPAIAYSDDSANEIRLAYYSGSSWTITAVDGTAAGSTAIKCYISFLPVIHTHVRIAYYDLTNHDLVYADGGISGPFAHAVIDSTGDVGNWVSMATNTTGAIHVSYYDATNSRIKFATSPTGTTWDVQFGPRTVSLLPAPAYNSPAKGPSKLAIGSDGVDHIVYVEDIRHGRTLITYSTAVRYATLSGSTWSIVTVNDFGSPVLADTIYVSMALNATNHASVGYNNPTGSAAVMMAVSVDYPSAATNLVAVAYPNEVKLTWTAPTYNGGLPLTNMTVYRDNGTGFALVASLPAMQTYFNDTGLINGHKYNYTVYASNGMGTTASAIVNATPVAKPSAPTWPATSVSGTSVTINWTAPSSTGGTAITSYKVYRGTSSGSLSLLTTVGASTLSFQDTGLSAGQSYFYKVTAVNSVGESAATNVVQANVPGLSSDMIIIIIVVIVVIAAVAAVAVIMMRRRKK